MKNLDDIKASEVTVMTDKLLRLFAYAGCDPTVCHACSRAIKVGHKFKLVPHCKLPLSTHTDEMCCEKCGEAELTKRDAREMKRSHNRVAPLNNRFGGYSRPSKEHL